MAKPGQQMDRFEAIEALGRGMFGSVLKARRLDDGQVVAIKALRADPAIRKAGLNEVKILGRIWSGPETQGRAHILRFYGHFDLGPHLCIAFQLMQLNLREVLRKYGKDVGLSLGAVQVYGRQLFAALGHLAALHIVHGDIKPDNILVNESKTTAVLADFGTSFAATEAQVAPYLASRFYRAPEVILGCVVGCPADVWSLGCTLFELYTGRVLFPGGTNNGMLRLMQAAKGPMPPRLVKAGREAGRHFDADGRFLYQDFDCLHERPMLRTMAFAQPLAPLLDAMVAADMTAAERHQVGLLADLVGKCLELQPERRPAPKAVLAHGFFSCKI